MRSTLPGGNEFDANYVVRRVGAGLAHFAAAVSLCVGWLFLVVWAVVVVGAMFTAHVSVGAVGLGFTGLGAIILTILSVIYVTWRHRIKELSTNTPKKGVVGRGVELAHAVKTGMKNSTDKDRAGGIAHGDWILPTRNDISTYIYVTASGLIAIGLIGWLVFSWSIIFPIIMGIVALSGAAYARFVLTEKPSPSRPAPSSVTSGTTPSNRKEK